MIKYLQGTIKQKRREENLKKAEFAQTQAALKEFNIEMRKRRLEELKNKKEIQRKTEEKLKMKRRRPNITKTKVALSLIQKHAQIQYNAAQKAHHNHKQQQAQGAL